MEFVALNLFEKLHDVGVGLSRPNGEVAVGIMNIVQHLALTFEGDIQASVAIMFLR
jgi:hypothetical protein